MRRSLLPAVAVALCALLTAPGAFAGDHAPTRERADRADVVRLPVAFQVQNVNRSKLACATDGRTYTVRGELIGPRRAFVQERDAVTFYLHGLDFGQFLWDFDAVPGFDYAAKQAAVGQVSLVIDRLGYDSSDKPEGFGSCLGGQADIAHQIVLKLRSGEYRVGKARKNAGPEFRDVVLAGHSVSGVIAELEAYSFGDIDGLILVATGERGPSPLAMDALKQALAVCAGGGERAEGPDTPTGYAYFAPTPAAFASSVFANGDPAVVAATVALRNRNPCGDLRTYEAGIATNLANVASIQVPVLEVIGRDDAIYPPPTGPNQVALLTGTNDVSLATIPKNGHAISLERTAPRFRAAVRQWLKARSFVATAAEEDAQE